MLNRLRAEAAAAGVDVPVPRVRKFANKVKDEAFFERFDGLPEHSFVPVDGVDAPANRFWPMRDTQTLRITDPEDEARVTSLRVLHMPGHTDDHVMLLLEEDNILMTADAVLGRGSTVFDDLIWFIHSLQRTLSLLKMRPASTLGVYGTPISGLSGENVLFPGHGPVVPMGKSAVRRYLQQRLEREEQLIALFLCDRNDKDSVSNTLLFPQKNFEAAQRHEGARYEWTVRQFMDAMFPGFKKPLYTSLARGIYLHLVKLCWSPKQYRPPPFFTREKVVLTEWSNQGPLVECLSLPSYQTSSDPWPDKPQNDDEYEEMYDLSWRLVA